MKKHVKYSVIISLLLVMGLFGCDKVTVTDPISPDNYPNATFTTDFDFTSGEIYEGDTITYKISLDRPFDAPILFSVRMDTLETKGDVDLDDIILTDDGGLPFVTIDAYKTEGELSIIIVDGDYLGDLAVENLRLEVGAFNIGEKYLFSPATENPLIDLNVINSNVCFSIEWDTDDDFDFWIQNPADDIFAAGWTSANPEVMSNLDVNDPDGTYYLVMDPYVVAQGVINYTMKVTYPDLTTEEFTGTFDNSTGELGTSLIYQIVKSGNTYTISAPPKGLDVNLLNPKRNK